MKNNKLKISHLLIFNKKTLKKVCEKEKVCTFAHPKTEGKDEWRGGGK